MFVEDKTVVMIADIIGSRTLQSRDSAQDEVLLAFEKAETRVRPKVPAYASVGDEFQTVFHSVAQAVRLTTFLRLLMPEHLELRLGVGVGSDRQLKSVQSPDIREGSAWWRARDAIEATKRAEKSGRSSAKTGFVAEDGLEQSSVRSVLLLRDHIIDRMRERDRRIALARLDGETQEETAVTEGVSQSAVSQSLHRSGGVALAELMANFTGDLS